MRISLSSLLLLVATSALAQPIGPAVPLTNTRYSTSGEPALATLVANGRTFLAAWTTPTGVRISRIDGASARIGTPVGGPAVGEPAIAPYAGGYVMNTGNGIRYLDDNGVSTGELAIGDYTTSARIASNGSSVMLAYLHIGLESEILGAFVDSGGRVLRKGVHIGTQSTTTPATLPYAVTSNGSGFAFLSEEGFDLELKLYDAAGNLGSYVKLEGPQSVVTGIPRYAALASDGRNYLAVWASGRALKAAALRPTGDIISTATVVPARDFHAPFEPALAFDGQSYVCSYLDGGAYSLRVSPDDLAVTNEALLDEHAVASTVAAAGGATIAAWARPGVRLIDLGSGGAVFARYLSSDGTLNNTFPISVAAQDQTNTAAASNGIDTLVTWMEGNSEQVSLMGGLLRADGSWQELGKLGRGGTFAPLAASDGHDFLVIGPFGAMRVSAEGDLVDRTPLGLGMLAATGVAWNGHDYVAVGEITPSGSSVSAGLGALTISPSGAVGALRNIRPPVASDRAERPAVASSGNDLLVTYTWWEPPCFECFFPVVTGSSARALRLSNSLDPLGAEIQFYPVDAVINTAVAWNGQNYVALAIDYAWIFAVRVASDGTLLGKTRVNPGDTFKKLGTPSATAAGSDVVIAWREIGLPGAINAGDAFVATVHADGTATPPQFFDPGARSTGDPIVVADATRAARIIRPLFLTAAPYFGAERLVVHSLGETLMPATPSLEIRSNSTGILLSWSDTAGAAGYRLEYRSARHDWQELESWYSLGPKSVPIAFGAGGAYQFRVKAIGWSGASYSNIATIDNSQRRRAVR